MPPDTSALTLAPNVASVVTVSSAFTSTRAQHWGRENEKGLWCKVGRRIGNGKGKGWHKYCRTSHVGVVI